MVEEFKDEKRERELDLGKNIYWTDEVKIRINEVLSFHIVLTMNRRKSS